MEIQEMKNNLPKAYSAENQNKQLTKDIY